MADRNVTVRLHRSIYPARALKETTTAFEELVEADISRDGDYHHVVLRPRGNDYTDEQLRHEFANFALSRAARHR